MLAHHAKQGEKCYSLYPHIYGHPGSQNAEAPKQRKAALWTLKMTALAFFDAAQFYETNGTIQMLPIFGFPFYP